MAAARKRPSARTAAEQRLVDDGQNMQEVRNADHKAKEEKKIYGKAKN